VEKRFVIECNVDTCTVKLH